jgi:hypothetical protein
LGSLAASKSVCGADVNCGGINCHSDDTVCTLRYYPLTAQVSNTGYNFYAKNNPAGFYFQANLGQSLAGSYLIPTSGDSAALCSSYTGIVAGQCAPPDLASAQTLCQFDSQCGGVNCLYNNNACTLRYLPLTTLVPNSNFNAYLKL